MSVGHMNRIEDLDGNPLWDKDLGGILGNVTSSTSSQGLPASLDKRIIHVTTYDEMLGYQNIASELAVFNLNGSYFKLSNGEFVRWVDTSNEKVIYVSTTGSDLNTGFDSSSPKQTIQGAIDTLALFGPYLQGQWAIEIGAGTYDRGRFPDDGLASELPIIVRGPDVGGHPNVPTAIISEGADNVTGVGLFARLKTVILVKDIKFIGWNGSTSSEGCSSNNNGSLFTENVHAENCTWGASAIGASRLDVKGGIFDNCGYLGGGGSSAGACTRTLFNSRHAIGTQNAGTLSFGPIFRNSAKGGFAQEGSTGHCDYVTIEDCGRGLEAGVNSRFNYTGTSFKRNVFDVYNNNSYVYGQDAVYGTGADESSIRIANTNLAASGNTRIFGNFEEAYSNGKRTFDVEYVNQLIQTTGAPTAFETVTLAGGMWRDLATTITQPKVLNFKITGQLNGSNGTKNINMRMGATGLTALIFAASEQGSFEAEGSIYFTDREEQFMTLRGYRHLGTSIRVSQDNVTEALTGDTDITLEAQVGNAADSVRIWTVEATLTG